MGNQELFVLIVITGFIFIIIYILKHPTNKSSPSGSRKLMETDNIFSGINQINNKIVKKQGETNDRA